MLQITPQMRVLVAVEAVDGRKGIDGLARLCRQVLAEDPFSGTVFLFRNRKHTSIRALVFDGLRNAALAGILDLPETALSRSLQVVAHRKRWCDSGGSPGPDAACCRRSEYQMCPCMEKSDARELSCQGDNILENLSS